MRPHSYWRLTKTVAILVATLTAAGCQSSAARHGSTATLTQTVPGEMARERHAHVIAASDNLADVLSSQNPILNDVPFSHRLINNIAVTNLLKGESATHAVRRLAQVHIIAPGPYRLVQADTLSGRLEYRSSSNGAHLVATVRAPNPQERKAGHTFIVTDLFGQASLHKLTTKQLIQPFNVSRSLKDKSAAQLQITPMAGDNDRDRLAYLQTLPRIEQDRADIMAIRTMLRLRMGQDNEASKLVQQGVVRFPDTPVYFTLAQLLFQRANNNNIETSKTLSLVMKQRFSTAQIRKSRQQVQLFLNEAVAI